MIDQQIRQRIQADFAALSVDSAAAADCFYQRLFQINPELRALFGDDLNRQGEKLMKTLAIVVQGLDRFESLKPALQKLGADHQGYGVLAEHYAQVGDALLWMLEQHLGDGFDQTSRACWQQLYQLIANQMRSSN